MSRASLLRLTLGAVLLASLGAAADNPGAGKPSETEQLGSKIRDLVGEVAALQSENQQLRAQVRLLQARLASTSNPAVVPAPNQIPENWKRSQFNGLTYYLIPLDSGRPATTQPAR
ncbi:MAG TPA: hypothetical protein VK797_05580 [Tepidisphaeraceae bacterium]|nr:hypothetical protein [Tepidisphaeraceae bacterium]